MSEMKQEFRDQSSQQKLPRKINSSTFTFRNLATIYISLRKYFLPLKLIPAQPISILVLVYYSEFDSGGYKVNI
jgi:hypothetical protein